MFQGKTGPDRLARIVRSNSLKNAVNYMNLGVRVRDYCYN